MEQRPENKYSPAEVVLARKLANLRIKLDFAPAPTYSEENLEVPIKKIDGIEVIVKFHMSNAGSKENVALSINHSKNYLSGNIFFRWFPFTKETAQEDTLRLLEVLKSLKFDKTNTTFKPSCDCEKKEEMIPEIWCGLFEDCETIQMKWDECCVCHEITNSKFKDCRHTICLECCGKLIEKGDDDDIIIKCPICREEHYAGDRDMEDELLETF